MGVEFAGEGVRDGACELLEVAALGVRLNLLDKRDFLLVDIDNEVLGLVGKQVLNDVIGGNVGARNDLEQQSNTRHLAVEVKLSRLEVNIAGQDVVHNDIFDEVGTVVFFVVILLDAGKADGEQLRILLGIFIGALHKHGVVVFCTAAKGFVCVTVDDERGGGAEGLGIDALVDLTDFPSSEHAITTEVSSITPMVLSTASFI